MTISNAIGRPTAITKEVTLKLVEALKLGLTNERACEYAGIDPATLYRHQTDDPAFARKISSAKYFPSLKARQIVMASLDKGDLPTAKWWLEKKDFDDSPKKKRFEVNIDASEYYTEPDFSRKSELDEEVLD